MVFQISFILLLRGANSSRASTWRSLEGSTPKLFHPHLTELGFPFFSAGLTGQDEDFGWGLKFHIQFN